MKHLAALVPLFMLAASPAASQPGAWSGGATAGGFYGTGFEEFALGSISDQHGWVGINGAFTITTVNEHAGSQHFRGTSNGGAWSFARSPFVESTGSLAYVAAWLAIGTTNPAPWEFTPGIANQGAITTVRVNADRSIDVLVASAVPEGTFVPTGASAPAGYFELLVHIQIASGAFEVFLDGTSIATGQGLRPGGLMALIVYSDMPAGTAGHTFDMDDLQIGGGAIPSTEGVPDGGFLSAARPSPFVDRAALDLRVDVPQRVVATMHDALGRRVALLLDGVLPAGAPQALVVDGEGLAPGTYVVRVVGETFSTSRRVVRAR
jgi:hypothetical protein